VKTFLDVYIFDHKHTLMYGLIVRYTCAYLEPICGYLSLLFV